MWEPSSMPQVPLTGKHEPGSAAAMDPTTRTQQPTVTGTSILAIKYKHGVMMVADTLGSYGSMARFRDLRRIRPVGGNTLIGASGEYSDFQATMQSLEDYVSWETNVDDGAKLEPSEVHSLVNRMMYNRRNKNDPLWNSYVIAGVDSKSGKSFLGLCDMAGVCWKDNQIATGFGSYIALALLRKQAERYKELSETDAAKILDDAMRVMFYRDARSLNRIQRATITASGAKISEPYSLETSWDWKFLHSRADGH